MEINKEGQVYDKVATVKDIIVESVKAQIENPNTYAYAAGVTYLQKMVFKKPIKDSINMGLRMGVIVVGTNIVLNLIHNKDVIKET